MLRIRVMPRVGVCEQTKFKPTSQLQRLVENLDVASTCTLLYMQQQKSNKTMVLSRKRRTLRLISAIVICRLTFSRHWSACNRGIAVSPSCLSVCLYVCLSVCLSLLQKYFSTVFIMAFLRRPFLRDAKKIRNPLQSIVAAFSFECAYLLCINSI